MKLELGSLLERRSSYLLYQDNAVGGFTVHTTGELTVPIVQQGVSAVPLNQPLKASQAFHALTS